MVLTSSHARETLDRLRGGTRGLIVGAVDFDAVADEDNVGVVVDGPVGIVGERWAVR